MNYTKEITDRILSEYNAKIGVEKIAAGLSVPKRSVIAKLSSLGVYQKETYKNKRGETPIRKSEYVEKIAKLLDMDLELVESLEKVTKVVLIAIEQKLSKPQQFGAEGTSLAEKWSQPC